jgi:hypothetical protein
VGFGVQIAKTHNQLKPENLNPPRERGSNPMCFNNLGLLRTIDVLLQGGHILHVTQYTGRVIDVLFVFIGMHSRTLSSKENSRESPCFNFI